MKETTAEFSMTTVTIIGIVVIAGLVTLLGPELKEYVINSWASISGSCPDGYTENRIGDKITCIESK